MSDNEYFCINFSYCKESHTIREVDFYECNTHMSFPISMTLEEKRTILESIWIEYLI